MAAPGRRQAKDYYRAVRDLTWANIWHDERPKFDGMETSAERERHAGLIRAIGDKGRSPNVDRSEVLQWVHERLEDESEKVRRYAIAAIAKLGSPEESEQLLLGVLRASATERERAAAADALRKLGCLLAPHTDEPMSVDRDAGSIDLAAEFPQQRESLRLHLRCRRGLEELVADELSDVCGTWLEVAEVRSCCVVATVGGHGSLGDAFRLRCFDTLGFELTRSRLSASAVAGAIASPRCESLMATLTRSDREGAPANLRYRLNLRHAETAALAPAKAREIAQRASAANARLLNDARQALWVVDVHAIDAGRAAGQDAFAAVTLRPRVRPNPRTAYQTATFYAGAHPPLAAAMVRMATMGSSGSRSRSSGSDGGGIQGHEVVWDPFCGTAMELIEAAIALPSVARLIGTDVNGAALDIARANVAAAKASGVVRADLETSFVQCDFRALAPPDETTSAAVGRDAPPPLGVGSCSLLISNPPLGRRVKVANLHALFADLFAVAARVLQPGGRLVVINPLRAAPSKGAGPTTLRLESRRMVDLGLRRDCSVEVWRQH